MCVYIYMNVYRCIPMYSRGAGECVRKEEAESREQDSEGEDDGGAVCVCVCVCVCVLSHVLCIVPLPPSPPIISAFLSYTHFFF